MTRLEDCDSESAGQASKALGSKVVSSSSSNVSPDLELVLRLADILMYFTACQQAGLLGSAHDHDQRIIRIQMLAAANAFATSITHLIRPNNSFKVVSELSTQYKESPMSLVILACCRPCATNGYVNHAA
jgi:hypothetical protein